MVQFPSLASLRKGNADSPDVMNSNRKLDVSLDGRVQRIWIPLLWLPLFKFVESEQWKRENINFWLPFWTSGTSTFLLPEVPFVTKQRDYDVTGIFDDYKVFANLINLTDSCLFEYFSLYGCYCFLLLLEESWWNMSLANKFKNTT